MTPKGTWHHSSETKAKIRLASLHNWQDPDYRTKRAKSYRCWNKGLTKESDARVAKLADGLKGKTPSSQCCVAVSKANMERIWTEEQRQKIGDRLRGKPSPLKGKGIHNEQYKLDLAKRMRENNPMSNSVSRNKVRQAKLGKPRPDMMGTRNINCNPNIIPLIQKGLHRKPTHPEEKLLELLNSTLPSQFAYNGGFELGITVASKIPDFVNIDGKKQVIELFGDYWHRDQNVDEFINRYQELGWDCLVVWEHELKDKANLIAKLREFSRKGEPG